MIVLRSVVVAVLLLAAGSAVHGQTPVSAALTPDEQETFLLEARIVRTRTIGSGITASRRVTLDHGGRTHDAHVQTVDIYRPVFEAGRSTELNFRDTYRYNIAAYRLARLIGLTTVPVSVERMFERSPAAFTWWVDDVAMDEAARAKARTVGPDPVRFVQQQQILHVFDELIQNRDRNPGNVLWTSDWTLWMIDHTRAFRTGRELRTPERLATCDRALLERLRTLTPEEVRDGMKGALNGLEMDALLARRALIVAHYDARIAEHGQGAVLFALRGPAPAALAAAD